MTLLLLHPERKKSYFEDFLSSKEKTDQNKYNSQKCAFKSLASLSEVIVTTYLD